MRVLTNPFLNTLTPELVTTIGEACLAAGTVLFVLGLANLGLSFWQPRLPYSSTLRRMGSIVLVLGATTMWGSTQLLTGASGPFLPVAAMFTLLAMLMISQVGNAILAGGHPPIRKKPRGSVAVNRPLRRPPAMFLDES